MLKIYQTHRASVVARVTKDGAWTLSRRHGRPQGGVERAFSPLLEIGTKKQKFLENVKSTV